MGIPQLPQFIQRRLNGGRSRGQTQACLLYTSIASGMFSGLFEIVVHDMPREQAQRDVEQFRQFYTGGWLTLMGG